MSGAVIEIWQQYHPTLLLPTVCLWGRLDEVRRTLIRYHPLNLRSLQDDKGCHSGSVNK